MEVAAGSFPFICVFSVHQSRAFVVILFHSLTECLSSYSAVLPTFHIGVALQHVTISGDLGSCHQRLLVFDVEHSQTLSAFIFGCP